VEKALIMLLVTSNEAGVFVYLSVRSEPGLIGLTCFSATIQSTHSNYMRKHGGKATPYLDYATNLNPERVLHDTLQYDWGDLYEGKSKRFLVLEVEEKFEEATGFVWVPLRLAKALLLEDDLVTNDLRSCLAMIISSLDLEEGHEPPEITGLAARPGDTSRTPDEHSAVTYQSMDKLRMDKTDDISYQDGFGNAVLFFRTTANSREVPVWTQPLLRVRGDKRITLFSSTGGEQQQYALRAFSQSGIPSTDLWAPSKPVGPSPGTRMVVLTSGEGGRFFRYRIYLELFMADAKVMRGLTWPDGTVWMAHDEVQGLISQSLVTSLELRLAWSLVMASRG
jgi:oxidase EvaA